MLPRESRASVHAYVQKNADVSRLIRISRSVIDDDWSWSDASLGTAPTGPCASASGPAPHALPKPKTILHKCRDREQVNPAT